MQLNKHKKDVELLNKKILEMEQENSNLKLQIKRIAADFDNFQRRASKEKEEITKYANEKLLFKFLDIVDNFEMALKVNKEQSDFNSMYSGFELIYQKILKIFNNEKVSRVESPVNKLFDVNFQESILHSPSNLPENYVIEEILPGYIINDKVLRYVKVVTSSGINNE